MALSAFLIKDGEPCEEDVRLGAALCTSLGADLGGAKGGDGGMDEVDLELTNLIL